MKNNSEIIYREYTITQKELKEKLKINGNIDNIELWCGLTPSEDKKGVSYDKVEWLIKTSETKICLGDDDE